MQRENLDKLELGCFFYLICLQLMVQGSKKGKESFPYLHGTVTLTPKLSYVFCFYYIAPDIEEPFLYVVDPLIFSSFVFSGPFRDITNPMALV
jgi:hypothetical protein